MNRVKDKVTLVTGGASGIGLAAVMALAREGAQVVVTDINEKAGLEAIQQLSAEGLEGFFLLQDVTREADWDLVVDEIEQRYGRLDVLVNNAGGALPSGFLPESFEDLKLEDFRANLSLNLESVLLGIQKCLPLLKANPQGAGIINISSVAGTIGETDLVSYSVAKVGVRWLTRLLATYCHERGYKIRVNGIYPGLIDTPLMHSMMQHFDLDKPGSVTRRHALTPEESRAGRPEEIAYAILYLASDESRFVHGLEMVVDGGLSIM